MLISCIACGHRISDRAPACPKCGTTATLKRGAEGDAPKYVSEAPSTAKRSTSPSPAHSGNMKTDGPKKSFPVGLVLFCMALGGAGVFVYTNFAGTREQSPRIVDSKGHAAVPHDPAAIQAASALDSSSGARDDNTADADSSHASESNVSNAQKRSFSPSFSCSAATSATEHAICEDEELASLDRQVAATYADALNLSGASRPELVSSQRQWVTTRDSQCSANAECLKQVMDERITQLHEIAASFSLGVRSEHNAPSNQIKALDDVLTVAGVWRYGDGTQQESDEGEWLCLELDRPSVAKSPLLEKFNGSICIANPDIAMRQMNLAPSKYREHCAYRAEGTATVELSELHQPQFDEMKGERVEASLVQVLKYEIVKPLTEEDCYQ